MQIYPPSSVAYATNCLQFSSPKGKPSIRPCEHGEYNFGKQTKNSRNKQNYKSNQASEFSLARPVVKNEGGAKASPWGKLSRKRLMRGDKSAFPIEIYRSVPINN